jgi:hypothetical protein
MEYFANELYAPLVFGVSTGGAGLKSNTGGYPLAASINRPAACQPGNAAAPDFELSPEFRSFGFEAGVSRREPTRFGMRRQTALQPKLIDLREQIPQSNNSNRETNTLTVAIGG